ncbi:MAG: TPM domain-containing protein [Eubacteriales bacterium]
MKKIFLMVTVTLTAFLTAFPVSAIGPDTVSDAGTSYVFDEAGILTDRQSETLDEKLASVSSLRDCDVMVLTVKSLGYRSAQAYADDYYDENGLGRGDGDDGILLLVSVYDREWAISTYGFGIEAITEDALDRIEDDIFTDLSEDRYYEAFLSYADTADFMLERAREGKPYRVFPWIIIPISLILGLVIALVCVNSMKKKLKSVRRATGASDYVRKNSLNIRDRRDVYLYSTVSKIPIPKDNGGGSGSSTHTSSSGRSHGGRSGRF